jgi:hypothetical protein
MPFSHCDEQPFTSSADLPFYLKFHFDLSPTLAQLDDFGGHMEWNSCWCGTPELNGVGGGDRAWWLVVTRCIHQRNSRSPIAVTVEQRPDDSSVHHTRKRLMFL